MAQFLRAKQSGLSGDFSHGLGQEDFFRTDIARYGINSQISVIAYDPIQSLIAVGTNESQYGSGQIYVFGQARVAAVLKLQRAASVRSLHFCVDKLVVQTSKNELVIFSLETRRGIASYTPSGYISCLHVDPSTDWAFIGLKSGEVVIYDLDRQQLAPLRISYQWKDVIPHAQPSPVLSLALHPRDLGTLLIGYSNGAMTYSLKQTRIIKYFRYEVQAGAPGGGGDLGASINSSRWPSLVQALWHPLGTFVLTAHADCSLVFWDAKDGRLVASRSITGTGIHLPGSALPAALGDIRNRVSVNEPIFKVAWCCARNPDETGVLLAGGGASSDPVKGLTFLDLGPTPNYATSSWQALTDHFDRPRQQKLLKTPPGFFPVDFCLVPKASPHYTGGQDPTVVIAVSSIGELQLLRFPSGESLVPTNLLPVSLCLLTPFVKSFNLSHASPDRFIGLTEKRNQHPPFLMGGAEATKALRRFERRTIALSQHKNGAIRVWDLGHGDEISNSLISQADVTIAVDRGTEVGVRCTSFSAATGELAVGMSTGEIIIFKWDRASSDTGPAFPMPNVENIRSRIDTTLTEGFMAFASLHEFQEPITSIHVSDVGFIVAGSLSGGIIVVDMRGPAVIFKSSIGLIAKPSKRDSHRRSSRMGMIESTDSASTFELAVMSVDDEEYSSILLLIGTNQGQILTVRLVPRGNGGFVAEPVGSTTMEGRVIKLCPINVVDGSSAVADQAAVAALGKGVVRSGVIAAISHQGARIFKPATAKGIVKTWDHTSCRVANYCHVVERGHFIVGIFGDRTTKILSVPGLKTLGEIALHGLDTTRLDEAHITEMGEVVGWAGPSEIVVIGTTCASQVNVKSVDRLYNPEAFMPLRPVITGMQWISGTQHVTLADLDLLIGGPERPPSKRMKEEMMKQEQEARRERSRPGPATAEAATPREGEEGYWAYMQRQLNERTENLNIVNDSMDRLGETSAKFSTDVSKFVSQQKRKALIGGLTGKWL